MKVRKVKWRLRKLKTNKKRGLDRVKEVEGQNINKIQNGKRMGMCPE